MIDETREIPLATIDFSPTNPRRTFNQEALEELAESIRMHGVVQPVLVRPVGERYELVCGERRVRASMLTARDTIIARVRSLDDRDVLEIQLVENSQREDVHPLEEARALRVLHEEHGYPVDELAAKLGRSTGFVTRRIALCGLSEGAQSALDRGRITIGVAELLARLVPEQQDRVIEHFALQEAPPTIAQVKSYIRWYVARRLSTVPWDIASSTLVPSAGACVTCPKRSSAQGDLFGDPDDEDRCLDWTCFESKRTAHWDLAERGARERGAQVLDAEKSRKIFPHGPHYLRDRSYITLDGECQPIASRFAADEPIPTWRDVLGDRAVTEFLCNVGGIPVSVARRDEVYAALEASPREGDPEISANSVADDHAKADEKRRQEEILAKETRGRVRLEVIRAVEGLVELQMDGAVGELERQVIDLIAETVLMAAWHDVAKSVARRRGAAEVTELVAAMKEAPLSTVVGIAVEALLTQSGIAVARLAQLFEVDEKLIRKAVRTELRAKEKAKAAREQKRRAKAAAKGASA